MVFKATQSWVHRRGLSTVQTSTAKTRPIETAPPVPITSEQSALRAIMQVRSTQGRQEPAGRESRIHSSFALLLNDTCPAPSSASCHSSLVDQRPANNIKLGYQKLSRLARSSASRDTQPSGDVSHDYKQPIIPTTFLALRHGSSSTDFSVLLREASQDENSAGEHKVQLDGRHTQARTSHSTSSPRTTGIGMGD